MINHERTRLALPPEVPIQDDLELYHLGDYNVTLQILNEQFKAPPEDLKKMFRFDILEWYYATHVQYNMHEDYFFGIDPSDSLEMNHTKPKFALGTLSICNLGGIGPVMSIAGLVNTSLNPEMPYEHIISVGYQRGGLLNYIGASYDASEIVGQNNYGHHKKRLNSSIGFYDSLTGVISQRMIERATLNRPKSADSVYIAHGYRLGESGISFDDTSSSSSLYPGNGFSLVNNLNYCYLEYKNADTLNNWSIAIPRHL